MRDYDFLLAYEHKNRELDAVCLLAIELERRGYSTFVYCGTDWKLKSKVNYAHAKVLVIPWAYDERAITYFAGTAFSFDKVVNLQWEQALTREQEEDPVGPKSPKGLCKEVAHIAWGEANYNRLISIVGVKPQKVFVGGNITLDFLRPPFQGYYIDRGELFDKYAIPKDKKVLLFIASFRAAFFDSKQLEESVKEYGETRRIQHEYAKKSYETIVDWLKDALIQDNDLYLVYRPHPGENKTLLKSDFEEVDRVSIISDESIKQWIMVADVISTWYSTSVAEVYAAGKSCIMPEPYKLPHVLVDDFFEGANTCCDKMEFVRALSSGNVEFPITKEKLDQYYSMDQKSSYLRVADALQIVISDEKYNVDKDYVRQIVEKRYYNNSFTKKVKRRLLSIEPIYDLICGETTDSEEKKETVSQSDIERRKQYISHFIQ